MITQLLTNLKELITLTAPITGLAAIIWKFWLKQKYEYTKKIVENISQEFRPNGGSTLRDAINRIETKLTHNQDMVMTLIKIQERGFFITDENGKLIEANNSLCKILNLTENELNGFNWLNIFNPPDKIEVKEAFQSQTNLNKIFILTDKTTIELITYKLNDDILTKTGYMGIIKKHIV